MHFGDKNVLLTSNHDCKTEFINVHNLIIFIYNLYYNNNYIDIYLGQNVI